MATAAPRGKSRSAPALLLAMGLTLAAGAGFAQTITTIAGNPATPPSFSGDGGPATLAQLDRPVALAVAPNGTVFVVDQTYNIIRAFTAGGTIDTVAGVASLAPAFGGDGAAAAGASFSGPTGIAVDGAGRIFVADAGNARIRMFTVGGTISTVAGGGSGGGPDGLGDGGLATDALLGIPQGIAVDGNGHVFVSDALHNVVRMFTVGGTISVVAGTPGLAGATGDGGPATAATLQAPSGLAVDGAGHIYVTDFTAEAVRLFTLGGTIATVAGTPRQQGFGGDGGPATSALLNQPMAASVDAAGNLYIADTGNWVIRRVAPNGVITTLAGTGAEIAIDSVGDGGPAALAALAGPIGVIPDGNGNILVADTEDSLIRRFPASAPAPALVASVLPGARSVLSTDVATVFATMVNATGATLGNCQITLPVPMPSPLLSLSYQTTDPTTNALTGTADTPVTLAANGFQSFLLSFGLDNSASAPVALPQQQLLFSCEGGDPAAVTPGVNTVDLSFSTSPVADVVALAAVSSRDGILDLPSGGAGAFGVAAVNLGAAQALTVSADTGTVALPLTLSICATNTAAQCLAAPAPNVSLAFSAGATPTFSIFATAQGPVTLAPATNRIFVRFKDSSGATRGSTSVAVQTQ